MDTISEKAAQTHIFNIVSAHKRLFSLSYNNFGFALCSRKDWAGGNVGIFGLAELANFWFLFFDSTVFQFWCFARFGSFLQFSLWFSVFRIFLSNTVSGFSSFAKEVTTCSCNKTEFPEATYIAFYILSSKA